MLAAALVPTFGSASGIAIVVDPAGDHINGGGPASDILGVDAELDRFNLYLTVQTAGMMATKDIHFRVTYANGTQTYRAVMDWYVVKDLATRFIERTDAAAFAVGGPCFGLGAAESRPGCREWIEGEWEVDAHDLNTELKMTVPRAYGIGQAPPPLTTLTSIAAFTTEVGTGVPFDSTLPGSFLLPSKNVKIIASQPTSKATKVGTPVTFTFTVQNQGAAATTIKLYPDDVLGTLFGGPSDWGVTVSPASLVALAPGSSATVTMTITPTYHRGYAVAGLRGTSTEGWTDRADVTITIPLFTTLTMTAATYDFSTPVGGAVSVKYSDNTPVAGVKVHIRESSTVLGERYGDVRTKILTTSAAGTASFTLPADILGSNFVGGHRVEAQVPAGAPADGSLATASYIVV